MFATLGRASCLLSGFPLVPLSCGTGSLFRRQPPSLPNSDGYAGRVQTPTDRIFGVVARSEDGLAQMPVVSPYRGAIIG
jgi:hypothetical protein